MALEDERCPGSLSSQSRESEKRELHQEKIAEIFRASSSTLQPNTDQHMHGNKLSKFQKEPLKWIGGNDPQSKDRKEIGLFPSPRVKNYIIQEALERELNHFSSIV